MTDLPAPESSPQELAALRALEDYLRGASGQTDGIPTAALLAIVEMADLALVVGMARRLVALDRALLAWDRSPDPSFWVMATRVRAVLSGAAVWNPDDGTFAWPDAWPV